MSEPLSIDANLGNTAGDPDDALTLIVTPLFICLSRPEHRRGDHVVAIRALILFAQQRREGANEATAPTFPAALRAVMALEIHDGDVTLLLMRLLWATRNHPDAFDGQPQTNAARAAYEAGSSGFLLHMLLQWEGLGTFVLRNVSTRVRHRLGESYEAISC